jgi:hypothetical protein
MGITAGLDVTTASMAEHVRLYLPVKVALPWGDPDGRPVTRALLFTSPAGGALNRNAFNRT